MPVRLVCGLSNTRKAARLAVYEATMIMAKPAQTIPRTRALKLLGVPEIQILNLISRQSERKNCLPIHQFLISSSRIDSQGILNENDKAKTNKECRHGKWLKTIFHPIASKRIPTV